MGTTRRCEIDWQTVDLPRGWTRLGQERGRLRINAQEAARRLEMTVIGYALVESGRARFANEDDYDYALARLAGRAA